MLVSELITLLKRFPQDYVIVVRDDETIFDLKTIKFSDHDIAILRKAVLIDLTGQAPLA